jgi:site-specific recombinase XerD
MDPAAPSLLLRSFERHLRAENRSDQTVATYLIALRRAEAFLAVRGTTLAEARRADLEAYLGDLLTRRAAATAATYYKVLKLLYQWLEEEDELPASPMAKMRPPIVPDRPVPVIPDDGLRRLLAACAGRGFEARRDAAMIMLLLDTGARRAELVDLKLAHVDLDLDVLLVLGKGRRERALPFGHKAGATLDRYLRARVRHKDAALPWLWLGLQGRLTKWGVGADAAPPRRGGRPARPASPPAAPHLRAPVAGRRRRGDRPDASSRLEVPRHAATVRRLGRRRPGPRGASPPLPGRPPLGRPRRPSCMTADELHHQCPRVPRCYPLRSATR